MNPEYETQDLAQPLNVPTGADAAVLVGVNLQQDFFEGPHGTDKARLAKVSMQEAVKRHGKNIVLTQLSHNFGYVKTLAGAHDGTPHCVQLTPGWGFDFDILQAVTEADKLYKVVKTSTFGAIGMLDPIWKAVRIPSYITIFGLNTDTGVLADALLLRTWFANTPIACLPWCCAGTTAEKHEMALEVMASCYIDIMSDLDMWDDWMKDILARSSN